MARRASTKAAPIDGDTRILVLDGLDHMLKGLHLAHLAQVLESAHGPVETYNYDGRSCQLAEVLDELRSYTLTQSHKIVIVDDADQFVSVPAHRKGLTRYAARPVQEATLVLRSDKWKPGNLDKMIQQVGALVKCDAPTAGQARAWLIKRSQAEHQCELGPKVAALLVERIGADLGRLDSELAKLVVLVRPNEAIDEALIDQIVGRSSDEQAYAVQEALLGSCADAQRGSPSSDGELCRQIIEKIHDLVDLSRQSDVLVTYFVADMVRKLHLGLMMKKQGIHGKDIARQLRLWGRSQSAFMRILEHLKEQKIALLFDAIVEADARSKRSLGTATRNLEGFCVRLAAAMR